MARPADSENDDLVAAKVHARKQASAARKRARDAAGPDAAARLANNLISCIAPTSGQIVSGFLSIGSEVDLSAAFAVLRGFGCRICLPCVIAPRTPLVFRLWDEGDALIVEPFGTRAPAPEAQVVDPDILLVPLLAFDQAGYRLGYGGGFYDRSLEALRQRKSVLAVGVAFEGQRVDAVPRGPHDQPLDWVVTEAGAFQPDLTGIESERPIQ